MEGMAPKNPAEVGTCGFRDSKRRIVFGRERVRYHSIGKASPVTVALPQKLTTTRLLITSLLGTISLYIFFFPCTVEDMKVFVFHIRASGRDVEF
eukprot:scaffold175_cov177-Amphora_coffeaeformis.AAC.9